jgi:very-short-patch-repair endonuclease
MSKSSLEEKMLFDMRCLRIKTPEREYRFHPERKWRFDFAWPWCSVAVEVDGGVWNKGGHARGGQIQKDHEKRNTATKIGWKVFTFGTNQVRSGDAAIFMKDVFDEMGAT